jgi:DNA-binding IclR family transcriptional regulator
METKTSYPVPAVARAIAILELLAESRRGSSISELSHKLSLPKSSVHLLVKTLEEKGYLQKHPQTGHYCLGLKLVSLSKKALDGLGLREEARPFMQSLMKKTGLTVHLGVLEGSEAVIVEKVEAPGLIKLATWVGRRLDAHCTGVGKALLAYLPEEAFDRLIKARALTRRNQKTIVSPGKLKRELLQVRSQGYAFDDEEDEIGLRCIGAVILDRDGRAIAALSIAGTTAQITAERVQPLAELAQETALSISSHFDQFGIASDAQLL